MKATPVDDSFRSILAGWRLKPTTILLVSTITLITWKCFASTQYYLEQLSDRFVWFSDPQATAAVYHFLGTLLLLGVVPALIVKFVFKESLAEYGVRFGDPVRTVRSFLVAVPIIALVSYGVAHNSSFWKEYPINRHAGASPQTFALHVLSYLMFYLGWEFHFRGFMQRGLQDSMGLGNAIFVQTMTSVLLHIGKPVGETYGSIIGG